MVRLSMLLSPALPALLAATALHAQTPAAGAQGPGGENPRIHEIVRAVDPARIDHVFVCGPFGVNDEAEAALLEAGVPPERIHIERFGVPGEGGAPVHFVQPDDADDATVVIVRDGLTRTVEAIRAEMEPGAAHNRSSAVRSGSRTC